MATPSVYPIFTKGSGDGGGGGPGTVVKNVVLTLNERQALNLTLKERPRLNLSVTSDRIVLTLKPKDNVTLDDTGITLETK